HSFDAIDKMDRILVKTMHPNKRNDSLRSDTDAWKYLIIHDLKRKKTDVHRKIQKKTHETRAATKLAGSLEHFSGNKSNEFHQTESSTARNVSFIHKLNCLERILR
uniref:Uncharacterized protein n=1 Tax=Parascaris univalens TaxID=6257 RepID=A0A915AD80_PARUN